MITAIRTHVRRIACVLGTTLVAGAAQSQSAPAQPAALLKWSMARYAKLNTYQADCAWTASFGGMTAGLPVNRTLWVKKPNLFKVVTSRDVGGMVQTSVCDGSKLVESATGIAIPSQRYAAPPSIAEVGSMQMTHPMFCGSPLYKFFGGPDQYVSLVDSSKMPVRLGASATIDGQACKTVKFWAKGPTYGTTEIAVSVADGLVRRIRYHSEPLMEIVRSGAAQQMLAEAMKSPEVQSQMQKSKTTLDSKEMKEAFAKAQAMTSSSLTTEEYHHIQVDRPIDPAVFRAEPPDPNQVQDVGGGSEPKPPVPLGRPAPALSLVGLDGVKRALADFKGKIVLIDFWATWCPPCRKGLPETERFFKEYAKRGLAVLTVSDEPKSAVAPFISDNRFTFPVYLDPNGVTNKAYHIEAIPTVVVIDRNGNLVDYKVGLTPREDILAALKKAGLNTR